MRGQAYSEKRRQDLRVTEASSPFFAPRRGRRGTVGRRGDLGRKRWQPLRSPRAMAFPESRGGQSGAAFRLLAMTIVEAWSGFW